MDGDNSIDQILHNSPLKKVMEQSALKASGTGRVRSARYSILSDPRLSQLFQLSSQLEALADSIEVKPLATPPPTENGGNDTFRRQGGEEEGDGGDDTPTPPVLPPKMNGSKTPNGNQPLLPLLPLPPKPNGNFEIQYQRLGNSEEDEGTLAVTVGTGSATNSCINQSGHRQNQVRKFVAAT